MGKKMKNMSGEERVAAAAERRRKKEEKARARNGGVAPDKEERARAKEEKAEVPLKERIPDHAHVWVLTPRWPVKAAQLAYVALLVYVLLGACDHRAEAEACAASGSLAGFSLVAAAAGHSLLLVGSFFSYVESLAVVWTLLPLAGLLALPLQLATLSALLDVPGAQTPAAAAALGLAGPTFTLGNWLVFYTPLPVLAVFIYLRMRLYALYFYDALAAFDTSARRFNTLFQCAAPLAVFAFWYAVLRRDGWLATDVYAWPGLGTLLFLSAGSVMPLWFLLKLGISRVYGPVMWNVYGRMGIAWHHNKGSNTLDPVFLVPAL